MINPLSVLVWDKNHFMSYVYQAIDGHWYWTGSLTKDGYGTGIKQDGQRTRAHRQAHEIFIGPIPDELQIDHLCRVRSCVNPKHLEAVTQQENIKRGNTGLPGKPRSYRVKSHCVRGHSKHDAYVKKNGARDCRTCRIEDSKRAYLKKKSNATA